MLRRKLILSFASLIMAAGLSGAAQASDLMAGVEYKKIPKEQSIAPAKMKVVEVFGYTCPHCYNLEPSLNKWLKNKSKNVTFERMPVIFNNPNWIFLGKAFYTLQELGILDQAHEAYFHAIHRDKKQIRSVEELAEFFTKYGANKDKFIATFNSFKVDQLTRRAHQMTRDYGIEGVPAIIVNGKYRTDVPMAGGHEELWDVVDKLTKK